MKLKVKIKDFRLRVRGKISSKEKLNTKELELLSNTNMRGVLKVKLVRKNQLEYEGPVGISLKKRLQAPFSKYEFLLVMAQILRLQGRFASTIYLCATYYLILIIYSLMR